MDDDRPSTWQLHIGTLLLKLAIDGCSSLYPQPLRY